MYRITEEIARKLIQNMKVPDLGPMDITQKNPFVPKSTKSLGFIDCYAAIGTEFDYIIEMPYSFINPVLPPIQTLDGYWIYRSAELKQPTEPFSVPRYLADPNVQNAEDMIDVTDCSIMLPKEWQKLSATSILTFEALIKNEPLLLDCLNGDLK